MNLDKKVADIYTELLIMEAKIKEFKQSLENLGATEEKSIKNKKTIVFDFDGVIHTGYEGWKDGSIYGKIDTELLEYIYQLQKEYYIVISSNRPAQQIVDYLNNICVMFGIYLVFEVFNKDMEDNMYWTKDDVIGVTNEKAVGAIYIDDRGYRYRGLEDLKEYIEVFGVELE